MTTPEPIQIEDGRSLPALSARFYALCRKHRIVPPIGPAGPPPQVEPEQRAAA